MGAHQPITYECCTGHEASLSLMHAWSSLEMVIVVIVPCVHRTRRQFHTQGQYSQSHQCCISRSGLACLIDIIPRPPAWHVPTLFREQMTGGNICRSFSFVRTITSHSLLVMDMIGKNLHIRWDFWQVYYHLAYHKAQFNTQAIAKLSFFFSFKSLSEQ